ncbi:hypothetical protein [Amycolatopsis pigmentata]|uniref:PaaI family thioesterase n=1 Tax=Amycolatopsis pigmentata TaxID=450801 RepID=A0ABW5FMH7_9PSEU
MPDPSKSAQSSTDPVRLPWLDAMASSGALGYFRSFLGYRHPLTRLPDGAISTHLTFSQEHTSYPGVVHGGVIGGVVDQLMGDTVALERQILAFSITLRVRMIRPLLVDRTYQAKARIDHDASGVICAEAEVLDDSPAVHVFATGSFRPIRSDQARDIMSLSTAERVALSEYFEKGVHPQ